MNVESQKLLCGAMNRVWQYIASDVFAAVEQDELPRDEVIELVLDADRLETMADLPKELVKEFRDLPEEQRRAICLQAFKYQTYC